MMYVVTACLVKQIMTEIYLVVQGWKTHHKMSLWAQRPHVYCVQVWLGLLFNWLLCGTLHHRSIVAVCNATIQWATVIWIWKRNDPIVEQQLKSLYGLSSISQ